MKFLKIWAAVALLLATSAVSYYVGSKQPTKDYDAACRMAGLIRCYEEHLSDRIIEDYNCFEELEGIFLHDDGMGEPINLNDYASY